MLLLTYIFFLFVKSLFFLTVVLWLSSFSRPLKQIIVFIRSKNMLNGIVCSRLLEIAMKCNAFNRSSSECRIIVFSTFSMSLGMDVLSTEIFSACTDWPSSFTVRDIYMERNDNNRTVYNYKRRSYCAKPSVQQIQFGLSHLLDRQTNKRTNKRSKQTIKPTVILLSFCMLYAKCLTVYRKTDVDLYTYTMRLYCFLTHCCLLCAH